MKIIFFLVFYETPIFLPKKFFFIPFFQANTFATLSFTSTFLAQNYILDSVVMFFIFMCHGQWPHSRIVLWSVF